MHVPSITAHTLRRNTLYLADTVVLAYNFESVPRHLSNERSGVPVAISKL
jgi:hypothetical protein